MECPNPRCDNKTMKCIVNEKIHKYRIQQRFICYCGAYVQLEYDLVAEY